MGISTHTLLTFIVGFCTAHFWFQHQYSQLLNNTSVVPYDTNDGQRSSRLQQFASTSSHKVRDDGIDIDGCNDTKVVGENITVGNKDDGDTAEGEEEEGEQHGPAPREKTETQPIAADSPEQTSSNNHNVLPETSSSTANQDQSPLFPPSHPCSHFGQSIPSAASYWNHHLDHIFNSSRHGERPGQTTFHDFTALLLHLMTSEHRLSQSVQSLPTASWDRIGELLQIAHRRYQWVQNGRPKRGEPRKLYVLVMGGSVTMGMGCDVNPVTNTTQQGPRDCAWPTRLKEFLKPHVPDAPSIIDVRAMTIGGTNTDSATAMWNYAVFPSDVRWPDIVIHAYSTNDMHVLSEEQARNMNITLDEMILRVNEKFVRTVLSRNPRPPIGPDGKPCSPKLPLLLYYDDYLGNEQRGLIQTRSFSKAVGVLSDYYGFGVMSYADAVRGMVYPNTNETWFSPNLWPERNVHPGMGMHIASTWVVAFNLLNLATTYCALPTTLLNSRIDGDTKTNTDKQTPFGYQPINGMPDLIGDTIIPDGPSQRPLQLPPFLDQNLTLDNVSTLWNDQTTDHQQTETTVHKQCSDRVLLKFSRPCIYSWISHLPKNPRKTWMIDQRMNPVLTSNDGWKAVDDSGKVGYASEQTGSTFVMEFRNVEKPVRAVTFMVMTSYGEMWEGSEVRVDVYVVRKGSENGVGGGGGGGLVNDEEANVTKSMTIVGYHDRHTSEIFPHTGVLEGEGAAAMIGDKLRIRVRHTGGKKFKIMGMAFCDNN